MTNKIKTRPHFFKSPVIPSLSRRWNRRWKNVILSKRSEVEELSRDPFRLPSSHPVNLVNPAQKTPRP